MPTSTTISTKIFLPDDRFERAEQIVALKAPLAAWEKALADAGVTHEEIVFSDDDAAPEVVVKSRKPRAPKTPPPPPAAATPPTIDLANIAEIGTAVEAAAGSAMAVERRGHRGG